MLFHRLRECIKGSHTSSPTYWEDISPPPYDFDDETDEIFTMSGKTVEHKVDPISIEYSAITESPKITFLDTPDIEALEKKALPTIPRSTIYPEIIENPTKSLPLPPTAYSSPVLNPVKRQSKPLPSTPTTMSCYYPSRSPCVAPSNFLSVYRKTDAINGVWNIDTSIEIPETLLPPLLENQLARSNLRMWSDTGDIDVELDLVRGVHVGRYLMTTDGNGSLRLSNSGNTKLLLRFRARNIKAYIPRNFTGLITAESKDGILRFSPGIAASVATISESESCTKHFIGDPKLVEKYTEPNQIWLEARTRREPVQLGEIYLSFVDEYRAHPEVKSEGGDESLTNILSSWR